MILLTLPNSCPCEHEVIALTSLITHKYYCENDVKSIISLLDRDVVWLGTAEHEYAAGLETVAEIFRRFAGQVPKCDISGEEYSTLPLGPDACLCAGRLWICHRPLPPASACGFISASPRRSGRQNRACAAVTFTSPIPTRKWWMTMWGSP